MKYLVIELQTNAENQVATIVTSHDSKLEAEAKFHTVLAAAAVSSVRQHGAMMFTSTGKFLESDCYTHPAPEPAPAPEPEEEPEGGEES